jgi:hypothetical protein
MGDELGERSSVGVRGGATRAAAIGCGWETGSGLAPPAFQKGAVRGPCPAAPCTFGATERGALNCGWGWGAKVRGGAVRGAGAELLGAMRCVGTGLSVGAGFAVARRRPGAAFGGACVWTFGRVGCGAPGLGKARGFARSSGGFSGCTARCRTADFGLGGEFVTDPRRIARACRGLYVCVVDSSSSQSIARSVAESKVRARSRDVNLRVVSSGSSQIADSSCSGSEFVDSPPPGLGIPSFAGTQVEVA